MTKVEFANKLEAYLKKQNRLKITHLILGVIFILFAFLPQTALFFSETMFGYTQSAFAVFAGLCLGKAWQIKTGSDEHELLVNAMELLSINKIDK